MAAVLVVEDNEALRKLVVMLLEQKGHHVLSASNGLEGLMVYTSYRARVDLVLTDIDMPQMDGIQLAARIRAQDPARKIVFMSGRAAGKLGRTGKLPRAFQAIFARQTVRHDRGRAEGAERTCPVSTVPDLGVNWYYSKAYRIAASRINDPRVVSPSSAGHPRRKRSTRCQSEPVHGDGGDQCRRVQGGMGVAEQPPDPRGDTGGTGEAQDPFAGPA